MRALEGGDHGRGRRRLGQAHLAEAQALVDLSYESQGDQRRQHAERVERDRDPGGLHDLIDRVEARPARETTDDVVQHEDAEPEVDDPRRKAEDPNRTLRWLLPYRKSGGTASDASAFKASSRPSTA